ncbi:hypothetical protein MZM54_00585 [[Brevibacterium] frigoritolerans]|nr:hypothetical protein [Peribacillus frigoritolerans]
MVETTNLHLIIIPFSLSIIFKGIALTMMGNNITSQDSRERLGSDKMKKEKKINVRVVNKPSKEALRNVAIYLKSIAERNKK